MLAPTWNKKFELPRGYFASDIQGAFKYIIKKHWTMTDNPPARIYVHKLGLRLE